MANAENKRRSRFEREALPLMGVLFAGALKLTRNTRDAEDLVQDTLVRALEKYHLFQPGTNLKAWLFRVMMNRFINLYRRRQSAPDRASFDQLAEFNGAEDQDALARDFSSAKAMANLMRDPVFLDSLDDRLKRALEGLSDDYREILIMNVIGDMPYRDIANALDIPIGTVMSRLSRAKNLLRDRVLELGREVIPGISAPAEAR